MSFIRNVIVTEVEILKNGVIHYEDAVGDSYYVDHRKKSKTKGEVFDRDPANKKAMRSNVKLTIVTDLYGKAEIA